MGNGRELTEEERRWYADRKKILREQKRNKPSSRKRTRTNEQKISSAKTRKKKKTEHLTANQRTGEMRESKSVKYVDFGECSVPCAFCNALHYVDEQLTKSSKANPKFPTLCCSGGKYIPLIREPPPVLKKLLTENTREGKLFRKNIRNYNNAFAMASVQANWESVLPGSSTWNPTVTVQGRMYHKIGGLVPPDGLPPRYASLYIHDTENSSSNRSRFFADLDPKIMFDLEKILIENNSLVQTFVSLRDLLNSNQIPEEMDLIIDAHKRNPTDHNRKYNLPEASEVALITTNEHCGPIDVRLIRKGSLNKNGYEKLKNIHLAHRMYDPSVYPLLLPFAEDGWNYELKFKIKGDDRDERRANEAKDGNSHNKERVKEADAQKKENTRKVSPVMFYGRLCFERSDSFSILLHSGRLFLQYLCEAFYKVETERLSYLRKRQDMFRASNYAELHDMIGDAEAARDEVEMLMNSDVGRVTVLPPSHIGSERNMRQKMHDIISISNKVGFPDIFLTMTCNPNWKEIQNSLLPGQKAYDRPELCNRVFRMKHKHLMKYLKSGKPFGTVAAYASVIEFQKRGLVHAHIILILSRDAKQRLQNPENVDKAISAEIPSEEDSDMRELVLKHMVHRPCSTDPGAPCRKSNPERCSKRYPIEFRKETAANEGDYYISYRRRAPQDGGELAEGKFRIANSYRNMTIDNSWVVPHCPELLMMYQCHMNVELCISRLGSIKYLFKYICKGSDRITVNLSKKGRQKHEITGQEAIDEIKMYQDARYYSASEAAWRLFTFPVVEHEPSVERMHVHLEDQHTVYYKKGEHMEAHLKGEYKSTKLMAWFDGNNLYPNARHIFYTDYPKYFTWDSKNTSWKPRKLLPGLTTKDGSTVPDFSKPVSSTIGRMYSVSPRDRERYYLRTLLLHKPGGKSFEDMMTIDGVVHESYRDACGALGLLSDDSEWNRCLQDAFKNTFEPLTKLFSTILVHCEPSDPKGIWNKNIESMIFDIRKRHMGNPQALALLNDDEKAKEYALGEVQGYLLETNGHINDFNLPTVPENLPPLPEIYVTIENEELRYENIVRGSVRHFNDSQRFVFDTIVDEVLPGVTSENVEKKVTSIARKSLSSRAYFLDAPGGTGKTFVIKAISSLLKWRKRKVITVASSAVAACLLDGGRTAHSTFKIPIPCFEESYCSIRMESSLAMLIRDADLIIWDEIVMCHRNAVEAVERTFRTIMNEPYIPFGGKLVLFSGDFRQILPVIPKGSRAMIVNACLKSSRLYTCLKTLKLTENMRLKSLKKDPIPDAAALEYPDYLLDMGEANIETDENSNVVLPESINSVSTVEELINNVFPDLETNFGQEGWLTSRAILATKNARLRELNELIAGKFPGKEQTYLSADSVRSDNDAETKKWELTYTQELLNSIEGSASLPDHELTIKKGIVVMLLRNILPKDGHVNGTRYIVQNMTKSLLFLRSVSGSHPGKQLTLPRINCLPGKEDFPIPGFRRKQFPVRACFAMTINKAQGQSISGKLGIDLGSDCFSHGQLYVALSRTTNPRNLYVLLNNEEGLAKNVVYPEVIGRSERPKRITPELERRKSTKTKKHSTPTLTKRSVPICVPEQEIIDFYIEDETPQLVSCNGIKLETTILQDFKESGQATPDLIDAFMSLLASENIFCFPTKFMQDPHYSRLDNLFKESDIRRLDECLIGFVLLQSDEVNWSLSVIKKKKREILLYDSLYDANSAGILYKVDLLALELWCSNIKRKHSGLRSWGSDDPRHIDIWEVDHTLLSPKQRNKTDGAIFAMANAYNYAKGVRKPAYTQDDIPFYRQKIYECIRKANLSPFVLENPNEVETISDGPNAQPDPYITCNGVRIKESELENVTSTAHGMDAWLYDVTIDAMMMFLESQRIHVWKSNVAQGIRVHGLTRLFTRDELPEELMKLNSCQIILAAINHAQVHWGLAIIDKSRYTISVYDSGNENADFEVQLNNILEFCQTARQKHPQLKNWPQESGTHNATRRWCYEITNNSPKQVGWWNCGVYTVLNACSYAKGVLQPAYDNGNMPEYRRQIYACLVNQDMSYLEI